MWNVTIFITVHRRVFRGCLQNLLDFHTVRMVDTKTPHIEYHIQVCYSLQYQSYRPRLSYCSLFGMCQKLIRQTAPNMFIRRGKTIINSGSGLSQISKLYSTIEDSIYSQHKENSCNNSNGRHPRQRFVTQFNSIKVILLENFKSFAFQINPYILHYFVSK